MKIFIDFDGVIFNTVKFVYDLDKIYFANGVDSRKLEEYKKSVSDTAHNKGAAYKPERLAAFVKKGDEKSQKKILFGINIFLKRLKKYVFPDALVFLKKIPREKLFLLSYGDVEFQKKKVFGSETGKYFSKLIINTDNKISYIIKTAKKGKFSEKEKIFFLDDKLENLEKIEKIQRKIITIWIKRSGVKYRKTIKCKADYEVANLEEAAEIIKNGR